MAISSVEIANIALTKLGASRIITMDDDVKQARAIRATFDPARRSELRAHNWTFAIVRKQLPVLADPPNWGFNFQYQLPEDCLRVIQVSDLFAGISLDDYRNGDRSSYAIEQHRIATDDGPPLKIRYIRDVTDAGQFDAVFCQALAARLAMELCEEITQSNTKMQWLQGVYKSVMMEAIRVDAIERPPNPLPDSEWVLGRL